VGAIGEGRRAGACPEQRSHPKGLHRYTPPRAAQAAAPELASHPSSVPPDLDQRRRDGHMTPEERHLLRQHIEDAVRELYKR
jgi:hypothetical protein